MKIDVDLNPPILKVQNAEEFDGNNHVKRKFLEEHSGEIVGWIDEWIKTPDLRAAMFLGGKRSIRFRLVNKKTVLVEQVLFLSVKESQN